MSTRYPAAFMPDYKLLRRGIFVAALAWASVFLWTDDAHAEDWPTKPIRVVVPFVPGGGVDILARAVMAELSRKWKQPIIVDNKSGAGSVIGADFVAKAPPDGYTLMATVNQTVVGNRFLYRSLPYDADKSFEPITLMVVSDQMMIANASFPANNLKELIALAKKEPGKIAYGSYGVGSQPQLIYETIKQREAIDLLHVPYKGITPVLQALAGGEVMLGSGSVAVAGPLIQGGRIKPIAIAGPKRLPQFPNVPTTVEQGFPYAQAAIWYALFAPAGTPPAVVKKIREDVQAVLTEPGFVQRNATDRGLTVVASDGESLKRTIQEETKLTGEQIKAANVTPE